MKISIQGNKGSYSEIAANKYFNKEVEINERDNFTDVFEDLKNDNADYIVIPIENSTHGSVYQNYDNLTNYNFKIIGEIYLKINFHLIVNPQTEIIEVEKIYTHPVGISQIQGYLRDNPSIKAVEYSDTAGSVKMIKEEKMLNAAAAASKYAAEIYGMKVLKENIHENSKNFTRFFVITKKDSEDKAEINNNNFKTTLEFQLGEEAGSLYKTLRAFADRDISLSKIESRPILNTDWKYRFYLDAETHEKDEKMQNALRELSDYVSELKVLGTYKKGIYIDT